MITITLPWWGFLIWGFLLVELSRFGGWLGDTTGRACVRWVRRHRESRP